MELLRNGRPRVVITGIGALTALGDAQSLWENLKAGRSGIRNIKYIDSDYLPVKIAAEVQDFEPTDYVDESVDRKELRRMGRASQLALSAATMAVRDAGFTPDDLEALGHRAGTVVGTTLGCHEIAEQNTYKYRLDRNKRPNPLALMNSLPNMPAHYISRFLRTLGMLTTPSTACAAGTQSIGEASDFIRHGRLDVAVAGGVEAIIQDYIVVGFDAMHALAADYNDNPSKASRPFDLNRSGFIIGEGCGIVILESLAHAIKRGARIYGEVLGYASSSDAFHVAAIDPEGMGATRSMSGALEDAHINPDEIDYINAHGTSTESNDKIETMAVKRVFGDHAYNLPISSTKSMIGHALAGAGAIEVVACTMSLCERVIHPTINYETPDPECDLDYTPNTARDYPKMRRLMSNSFGLGGQNASIILGSL